MQFRASLKQLWIESKENPGFTSLYVGGVAFAVAFTMIFAIIYYVHLAPIYPEYNRSTTGYINNIEVYNQKSGMMSQSCPGMLFYDRYIKDSENIEYAAITSDSQSLIQPPDNSGDFEVISRFIDPNFFKLYSYKFLAGRPFNEAETEAAMNLAVIDETTANRLYGSSENAIDKEISVTFKPKRIIGVVRNGNPVAYTSYANVFIPYTVYIKQNGGSRNPSDDKRELLGEFSFPIKFKDSQQMEKFREELADKISRVNATDTAGWEIDTHNAPMTHTMKVLAQTNGGQDIDTKEALRPLLLTLVVLLLIPAINISGMIGGQMDRRLAEIGVRRSFGATRGQLTGQVMFENFVLTLAGGFIGLLISLIVIITSRDMLLKIIIPSWQVMDAPAEVSTEMMLSPFIFLMTIILCLLLNLLSAYIPVRMSLRRPIISSLNSKR
ncbi:MAG: ABC transporter permease [Bacteroides sp.]|nr:ABC transporter permease [Bacteroides sp.]